MNTKNYEITISPNYVNNWGINEAIREILQNAIDGDKCGYESEIVYDNNCLIIKNIGAKLDAKDLILGCSSKEDQYGLIGKYGEGFKLALVVLLRKGMKITIFNGNKIWIPSFKISDIFKTQVLNIEETECNNNKDLSFEISPIDESLFNSLKTYFPCIENNFGETIETKNGSVLLDSKYKGKMFVEGLYIQTDENFKYGYNFNSESVDLDRDRKAINYYELRRLTAEAIVSSETCHPEIFKAIGDSCVDVKDIEDVLDEANESFLEEYRDMFYEQNNLEENTLVATESVMKQLNQMNLDVSVAKGTEIESYLIAKANDKLGLIEKAKEEMRNKDAIVELLEDFKNSSYIYLMRWFLVNKKYLTKKASNDFLEILNNQLRMSGFYKIEKYLDSNCDYSDEYIDKIIRNYEEGDL